ncbi:legumin B-like [Gymnodraco acuticeps]|uniref:Legumin B-like n=1 Tax=Gymnodraco acuticeps TaxID=8218 RepID=A0A6P8TBH8_GYMAC|nr:legumin B-like [Gymnodraco acuticeps]
MIRTQRGEEQAKDATNEHWNPKENFTAIKPKLKDDGTIEGEEQVEEERKESNGMKRKQPDMMESDSDEEEEEEEEKIPRKSSEKPCVWPPPSYTPLDACLSLPPP